MDFIFFVMPGILFTMPFVFYASHKFLGKVFYLAWFIYIFLSFLIHVTAVRSSQEMGGVQHVDFEALERKTRIQDKEMAIKVENLSIFRYFYLFSGLK
jgi:hypothetical protein